MCPSDQIFCAYKVGNDDGPVFQKAEQTEGLRAFLMDPKKGGKLAKRKFTKVFLSLFFSFVKKCNFFLTFFQNGFFDQNLYFRKEFSIWLFTQKLRGCADYKCQYTRVSKTHCKSALDSWSQESNERQEIPCHLWGDRFLIEGLNCFAGFTDAFSRGTKIR